MNLQVFLNSILGIACLSLAATPANAGPRDSGGGAACVDTNGELSTLYYCGAYHENPAPTPSTLPSALSIDGPSEQPGDLQALQSYISDFPYLEQSTKTALLYAMTPSFTRKYFSTIAPPDLTAPIVARIKAEFHRATGLDPSHLTLYAVTDTNAHMDNYPVPIQVTYLLPAFFQLPTQEQRMVALFHENLWVLDPNADYSTIIGLETSFEAVVAQPGNTARLLDFVSKIQGPNPYPGFMSLVLKNDIESGALSGLVKPDQTLSDLDLFGLPNIQCFERMRDFSENRHGEDTQPCLTGVEDHLDSLRRTYPKSLALAMIGDEVKSLIPMRVTSTEIFPIILAYLDGRINSVTQSQNADMHIDDYLQYYLSLGLPPAGPGEENMGDGTSPSPNDLSLSILLRSIDRNTQVQQEDQKDQTILGFWLNYLSYTLPPEASVLIKINTDPASISTGLLKPVTPPPALIPGPTHSSCFLGLFCS